MNGSLVNNLTPLFFESHAHYDDNRFRDDRDILINSLFEEHGIGWIMNIGSDMPSSRQSIQLAEKYKKVYACIGVHPHEAKSMTKQDLILLEEYAKYPKVVAVGEIGLDFFYDHSDRGTQREWFQKQLELAKKLSLPIVIHSRDACQECFDFVKECGIRKGVIHCFTGSPEMAAEYVKLGFFIGVGGVVTYKKARLQDVVKSIPLDNILIETDCPYLAPEPVRGTRNDSSNLKHIVSKIALIKEIPQNEIIQVTANNAAKLFGIPLV